MEVALGRKIDRDECVHHINGNKLDNRLKNLELIDRRKHSRDHRRIYKELLQLRRGNQELRHEIAELKVQLNNSN